MSGDEGLGPVLYVGLGAAADGGAALREFAGALGGETGATFVLVQRASAGDAGLDAAQLAAITALEVRAAVDGAPAERDTLYLAASGDRVRLDGDVLRVRTVAPGDAEGPIDALFLSLAAQAGPRSAGVGFRGTAPDGGRGLRAIKGAGGLVLVQAPSPDEPGASSRAGESAAPADFTLQPTDLAARLESYAGHPLVAGTGGHLTRELESDDRSLARVFELLRAHGRIDFAHYKSSTVAQRIERRMDVHRIDDLGGYLTLLEADEHELRTLGRALLVQSTSFFRDPDAFARLDAAVVRGLVERDEHRGELRAWVAGCATGEEAWSLAILCDEAQKRSGRHRRVKIFATDVGAEAIDRASRARYARERVAGISPERLARHFVRDGDAFVPNSALRQRVVFSTHDLVADPPIPHVDLVSCRNVLAQFQQAVQQRVVASFHFALRRDGGLFLGATEGIGKLDAHFETLDARLGVYRRLGADRVPLSTSRRTAGTTKAPAPAGLPPVTDLLRGYRAGRRGHLHEHVKDALLHDHVPPCIVLDAARRAVHAYGEAGRYLARFPTGHTSPDVHDIVADELTAAVSTALARVERDGGRARYDDILVAGATGRAEDGGPPVLLDLEVEHHPERDGRPAWYVVLFHERRHEHSPARRPVREDARRARDGLEADNRTRVRLADLEVELSRARERLGHASEEFDAVHEGLLAANDALSTSNERLQKANAALRATNAELAALVARHRRELAGISGSESDAP